MRRALHRYGAHEAQVAEAFEPAREPAGVAVLLHGGFWRDRYDRHLMDELCLDLAARGWAAWNVEYRRLGSGGGWPATGEDVAAAIARLVGDGAVAIGHSAGGHLALWAAAEGLVRGAVGQAAVSDLGEARRLRLGNDVVHDLLAGAPPNAASPAARLPLRVPQLLVHGEADDTVPVAMSRDYAEAARAAGDQVELVVLRGAGHYEHLDPRSEAWAAVVRWLT